MSNKKITIIILFQFFIICGQGFDLNDNELHAKEQSTAKKCSKQGGKWIKNQCMFFAAGLYWQEKVSRLNWYNGRIYCKRKGLRLPTLKELRAGCNTGMKQFKIPSRRLYMSSTSRDTYRVWSVWSHHCGIEKAPKVAVWHIRCVPN